MVCIDLDHQDYLEKIKEQTIDFEFCPFCGLPLIVKSPTDDVFFSFTDDSTVANDWECLKLPPGSASDNS